MTTSREKFEALPPELQFEKLLAIYTLLDRNGYEEDAENAYFEQFAGDETGFQHEPQTLVADFLRRVGRLP